MSDTYDRILASVPVNKAAALALSGGGEHFETKTRATVHHWSDPQPCRPAPDAIKHLSGKRYGRLTVVGFLVSPPGRWLCRCVCGRYTARSSKAVRTGSAVDRCDDCRATGVLQKRASTLPQEGRR